MTSPDILSHGFEAITIDQGRDYSGPVRCTVVRKLSGKSRGRAVLYVHGFSDYFFQAEMADEFVNHGYDFYAVDLRKYGRSLLPGQRMFEVRDISEYFADIDAALGVIHADGGREVALLGHSTGGLTTALYMAQRPSPLVKLLMLNSPFLAWNLPAPVRRFAVPAVGFISKLLPHLKVHQPADAGYARSLHAELGGEWNYRRDWKPDIMPDPNAAWVAAIDRAQKELRLCRIDVPVLLMCSALSAHRGDTASAYASADAILDVNAISEAGRALGPDITEAVFEGGLHDLVLSRPKVRAEVYGTMLGFMAAHGM